MMPTAIRPTAVNRAMGPQFRPWLTLTGVIGLRGEPPLPPPDEAGGVLAPGFPPAFAPTVTTFGRGCSPPCVLRLMVVSVTSRGGRARHVVGRGNQKSTRLA